MSNDLLKPADAGKRLGLSRATIYRLIASGELATVHVGERRATRLEETEVAAYIERNREGRRSA